GRMIVVSNEENFRPEILVQLVLVFDYGQIIAGRDHAAVQDDEIGFTRGKDDRLLRATAQGDAGKKDGGVIRKFTEEAIIHESSAIFIGVMAFIASAALPCEALFFTAARKLHTV